MIRSNLVCTVNYIYSQYKLLLLFSHELVATMQSVVTGQAPITLERKIAPGMKQ